MKIKYQTVTLLITALIAACGGDNTVSENTASQNIEGVWDMTEEIDGDLDIGYVVVRSNGTVSEYDYLGDSVDNNAPCYFKDDFVLTHEETNSLSATYEKGFLNNIEFSIENDSLKITGKEFSGENFVDVLPAVGLSESDLIPVCPDDFVI